MCTHVYRNKPRTYVRNCNPNTQTADSGKLSYNVTTSMNEEKCAGCYWKSTISSGNRNSARPVGLIVLDKGEPSTEQLIIRIE